MPGVFIVLTLLTSLALLVWGQWVFARKAQAKQLALALQMVGRLKILIGLTQKHRGLVATFLQGNSTVKNDIQTLRHNISSEINNINAFELSSEEARWASYLDHWHRLEQSSTSLEPPSSFKQHTSLIETMLYLLQDVAERIELADKKQVMVEFYFLWQEFPQAIEYIGQSRAVGVATATKGVSTQIDKVKLGYLCEKIIHLTSSVFEKLSTVKVTTTQGQIEQAQQTCEKLTTTIRRELINVEKVTYDNQQYFQLASEAMNQCNALLDLELTHIKSLYAREN